MSAVRVYVRDSGHLMSRRLGHAARRRRENSLLATTHMAFDLGRAVGFQYPHKPVSPLGPGVFPHTDSERHRSHGPARTSSRMHWVSVPPAMNYLSYTVCIHSALPAPLTARCRTRWAFSPLLLTRSFVTRHRQVMGTTANVPCRPCTQGYAHHLTTVMEGILNRIR